MEFTGPGATSNGSNPTGALTLGADGSLYGTTSITTGAGSYGTLFRVTPAGVLATLVNFGGSRGQNPLDGVTLGTDGNFYGTTGYGAANNGGTVFRVTPAGGLATLAQFGDSSAASLGLGTGPFAAVAQGADGSFYGTTYFGGASGSGAIFRMMPTGGLTKLVDFSGTNGANRGSQSHAALARGTDGNFYGTAYSGGTGDLGTVFRLRFGPAPVTLPASAVTATSATLSGTVNPNGTASTAFFEYGTSPNALTTATAVQSIAAGTSPVAVSANLAGLSTGVTYYFRLRADNAEQFQPQRGEVLPVAGGAADSSSRLISFALEPSAGVRIRWQGIPGRAYQIQSNGTLTGAWQTLAGTTTASQGGVIDYLDSAPSLPARCFYRTVLVP